VEQWAATRGTGIAFGMNQGRRGEITSRQMGRTPRHDALHQTQRQKIWIRIFPDR
jgi:hypothetical protein